MGPNESRDRIRYTTTRKHNTVLDGLELFRTILSITHVAHTPYIESYSCFLLFTGDTHTHGTLCSQLRNAACVGNNMCYYRDLSA